jgi:hypothetical protein
MWLSDFDSRKLCSAQAELAIASHFVMAQCSHNSISFRNVSKLSCDQVDMHAHLYAVCLQANKRHIQVLDRHLRSFMVPGSDAKVLYNYFTGSWSILQPPLTRCDGDCGLYACRHGANRSMSSALSTDVSFLRLHSHDPSTVPQPLTPLEPSAWSRDDDSDIVETLFSSKPSVATSARGPSATGSTTQQNTEATCANTAREPQMHACTAYKGPSATESSTQPHRRHDSVHEDMFLEDSGIAPPHGSVSMEFRRVRGDAACMTEQARRPVLNSLLRTVPSSSSTGQPSSEIADACMCLEGLWCVPPLACRKHLASLASYRSMNSVGLSGEDG